MNYSFFTPLPKRKYGYDYVLNVIIFLNRNNQFPPVSSPG